MVWKCRGVQDTLKIISRPYKVLKCSSKGFAHALCVCCVFSATLTLELSECKVCQSCEVILE
jgi:hypothetical protein